MSDVRAYQWNQMPRETMFGGLAERVAMRGDQSIVTINWIQPGAPNRPPHSHPFDQIVIIAQGSCEMLVDGVLHPMAEGAMMRVPANVPHTLHVTGDKPVLNIDVFAPAREDYLYLTAYQNFEASAETQSKARPD